MEALIRSRLIFGEYFYATEWGLPEIFTDYIDFRIDPTWYEFEGVEYTNESATAPDSLSRFFTILRQILPKI